MIVGFAEAEYSITENGNGQEVCTELTGRTQIPVSVSLVTIIIDGSATGKSTIVLVDILSHASNNYVPYYLHYIIDPSDFMSGNVSVTFEPQPDGQSSPQCTDITIIDDDLLEGDESFTIEIQNPSEGVSPDPLANSATVIIADDDSTFLIIF